MSKIFNKLTELPSIGPKLAKPFSALIGNDRIIDLLYHFPSKNLNKKFLPKLYDIHSKEYAICQVTVENIQKGRNKNSPTRIRCFSPNGYLDLVFFKIYPGFIEKNFSIGKEIAVSGLIEKFNDSWQIIHPEYITPAEQINKIPKNEIYYPATAKINSNSTKNATTNHQ